MRYTAVLLIVLIISTVCIATEDTVKLVKNIKPAVVLIQTFDANNSPLATGSGFFIDNKGSLITNHHVIEGAYSATVKTSQGKEYQITAILAKDTEADIVKLSVDMATTAKRKLTLDEMATIPKQTLPHEQPADANVAFLKLSKQIPSEGEDIVVVGNPLGLESSVSTGIVSAVRDIPAFGTIIQITAPISPGSSGSPVVNSKGEVIGVATLVMTKGQNLNFAMPAEKIFTLRETAKSVSLKEYIVQTLASDANNAQKLYEEGLQRVWAKDWPEALKYFEKATRLNPQHADAWFNIGYCYGKLGRYKEAIEAYKQAIKINPDDAVAYHNLGVDYDFLHHNSEAMAAFKQAIRIKPDYANAYFGIGNLYDPDHCAEAIEAFKCAIRINPDFADAHFNLGIRYLLINNKTSALDEYKILKTLDKELADNLFNLIYK